MITLTEIFTILIIHWIADFVLQTDEQAKNKSKKISHLLAHTITYSIVWWWFLIIYQSVKIYLDKGCIEPDTDGLFIMRNSILFSVITFITHTVTDYFTSRLNSKLWTEDKTHYFFVSVGFDQILHYVQLFLTYYYLKQL
jgi:hypothetical protein